MNWNIVFFPKYLILGLILLLFSPGYSQVKNKETVSISGFIEKINENLDVIHVKGRRILIPPKIKRVDEHGNTFKKSLSRNPYVEIEALQYRDDLWAKKLRVKSQPTGLK